MGGENINAKSNSPPNRHHAHHSGLDACIELTEHAHHAVESVSSFLEHGNSGLKFVSGLKAYKEYSWIRNAPIKTLNELSGLKRVVIINRGWKFVHSITIENAEKLSKFGEYVALAGVAISIAKSHEKFKKISESGDNNSIKIQRYLSLGSMAVFNSIGAPIVPLTHLVTKAVAKACDVVHAPNSALSVNARALDMVVHSSYDKMMDSDNVVNFINTHLVFP